MKIGIFQDVHANLPALEKALAFFKSQGCTIIYHVGDLIGIGPYPKECLDLVHATQEMKCIMGNHDYWYAFGLPNPIPEYMSDEEVDHQNWVHDQIGLEHKVFVQQWKFYEVLKVEGFRFDFRHYGLNKDKTWFKSFLKKPTQTTLDDLFDDVVAEVIFYGHQHIPNDTKGRSHYVNLGSAGCHDRPEVRLGILEVSEGEYELKKYTLEYEDGALMEEFDRRGVPARDFIRKAFVIRKVNN